MPYVKVANQLAGNIFVEYYYDDAQTFIQKIPANETKELSNPVLIDSGITVTAENREYGIEYCANDTELTVSAGGETGVLLNW